MTDPVTLESRLQTLAQLVETLEKGEVSLEEALRQYERGIALIRECQQELNRAEQTILRLQQNGDSESLVPFEAP